MSAYTRGPWALCGVQIRADNGRGRHVGTYQICGADGVLMSRAPEMFEALRNFAFSNNTEQWGRNVAAIVDMVDDIDAQLTRENLITSTRRALSNDSLSIKTCLCDGLLDVEHNEEAKREHADAFISVLELYLLLCDANDEIDRLKGQPKRRMIEMVATPRYDALRSELGKLFEQLEANRGHVVLIGSSPLAERGLRDVNDLDALVHPLLLDKLLRNRSDVVRRLGWTGSVIDPMTSILAFMTPSGMIQISSDVPTFVTAAGLSTYDVIRAAVDSAEGWLVMSIPHMIAAKGQRRMDKDIADLRLVAANK